MMGRWGLGPVFVVAAASLAPTAALAQTPATVNARVEISAAVAGSSATQEAIERQANARDRVRQQEIAALQAQLSEAETRGAAEVARLQAELSRRAMPWSVIWLRAIEPMPRRSRCSARR
jgi:hypothetical protein